MLFSMMIIIIDPQVGFCNEEQLVQTQPPRPPVAYQDYELKTQSFVGNTIKPSSLRAWENFVPLSHSMPLDTSQPIPVPRLRWVRNIERLTPEINVWHAALQHFYLPLMDASKQLDESAQQLWKAGSSPNTNCDAYLKIQGFAVAIGQWQLQQQAECLLPSFALVHVHLNALVNDCGERNHQGHSPGFRADWVPLDWMNAHVSAFCRSWYSFWVLAQPAGADTLAGSRLSHLGI